MANEQTLRKRNLPVPSPVFLKRSTTFAEAQRRHFDCKHYNDCLHQTAIVEDRTVQGFVCDDCKCYKKEKKRQLISTKILEAFAISTPFSRSVPEKKPPK